MRAATGSPGRPRHRTAFRAAPVRSPREAAGDEEIGPKRRVLVVDAAPGGGACLLGSLLYTAHLRAEVVGFQVNADAVRAKHRFQGVRHLLADPFLHADP